MVCLTKLFVFLSPMLSKSQIKVFSSLKSKKFRQKYGLFLVEGKKSVQELLKSDYEVSALLFYADPEDLSHNLGSEVHVYSQCGPFFKSISSFLSLPEVIAVAKIKKPVPQYTNPEVFSFPPITLYLDQVQDPGNLGTIMRNALWYGVRRIFLGPGCADPYNPKVIQSSMGAFTQVHCIHVLPDLWLNFARKKQIAIIGADLEGQSIHDFTIKGSCIVVLGNEGSGISKEVQPFLSHQITIPGSGLMESLNVAVASAIILDNWYRIHGM